MRSVPDGHASGRRALEPCRRALSFGVLAAAGGVGAVLMALGWHAGVSRSDPLATAFAFLAWLAIPFALLLLILAWRDEAERGRSEDDGPQAGGLPRPRVS